MNQTDELLIRITKEIVIKLIEANKVSLTNFENAWKQIYTTIRETARERPNK